MRAKYITKLVTFTTALLLLSACGGGGGGDASFKDGSTIVPIDIICKTAPTINDISTYIALQSKDAIVKDDANTIVSIYHDINSNKKVCLVSGNAHIVR